MDYKNHEIISIQLALIFNKRLLSPEDAYIGLKSHSIAQKLDVKPKLTTFPDDSKLDQIAVVSLENDYKKVLISRIRADYYFGGTRETFEQMEKEAFEDIKSYFDFVSGTLKEQGISISGIGFVVKFFFPEKHAGELITKMLKIDPLKFLGGTTIANSHIRTVTNQPIEKMKIRNYLSLSTVDASSKNEKLSRGIEVTRDFNNVEQKDIEICWEDVIKVTEFAKSNFKLNEIISLLSDDTR